MDPIVVELPASLTDDEFMAAVTAMQQRLTAFGVPPGAQWIDLSQAADGGWLLTGREWGA
jgi:hypothetical protein